MTEQELRDKIVEILRYHRDDFIEENYRRDIERIDFYALADALIAAGIGDVERQHDVFKKAYMDFFTKLYLDKKFHKNFDSITLGCQIGKFEDMIARAEKELAEEEHATAMAVLRAAEAEHRAEVAERALDKATELAYTYRTQDDTLSCSSCPFDSIFDRCKERGLYEDCSKRWKEELLQQAEKELQEERKDD